MSVNQDNKTFIKRKRQIPDISEEHGFLDEKVQTLKGSRSSYIGKITSNINKTSKYINRKGIERGKLYLCIKNLDKYIHKIKTVSCELRSYFSRNLLKDIYTDQKFWIIKTKKFALAHKHIMPYQELPGAFPTPSPKKQKKSTPKKKVIFLKTEHSSSNIKKILIFSQKRAFFIFFQKKVFLTFPEMKPCTFHLKLKNKKIPLRENFLNFRKPKPQKISCVF